MKNKNIGLTVFCQLVFMASFVFCSKNVSAYSIQITTNDNIVADVSPEGTGVSIHRESIRVVSNCRSGYNLSIATSESSNLYIDGDNSNPGSFSAVDGTSALNSNNNTNKWGYTLTSSPSGNTVFSPLSTTAAPLKTSAQTASPSRDINDNFYIHYGLKADYTLTPGSYQMANDGVIIYYLTMDTTCTQYTIAYNANGGTGTMTSQTLQEGESANLTAKAFTAPTGASYTNANNTTINGDANKLWAFWGWNTAADGTGDWYEDKEEITDLVGAGSTVTMYAQWKQATLADMTAGTPIGTEKVIDHNLMQDMLPEACYNSPITTAANAPAATLLDYRGKVTTGDNPESPEQYNVSKLADGLCWMTTNLNLGRSTGGPNGDGTITLTPDDTDITSNFTLPAHSTTSSTTNTAARIRVTNNSGTNANGVYYSWAAAVANTTSISTNPTTSVCPKGWDLPLNAQFTNLSSKSSYSSSNPPTAAPSSFLNGKFTNGATFYPSSYNYGFYWSSTSSSTTAAYGARTTASALSTSASTGTTYGGNKYYEKNLRCVASQGTVTVNYDGNGTNEYPVTGTTASQEVEISVGANAQANGFTRNGGWAFTGWNTEPEPDGSGTSIAASASIPTTLLKPGASITLYAQWKYAYSIQYDGNGATNSNGMGTTSSGVKSVRQINVGEGDPVVLLPSNFKRAGHGFAGWSTDPDAWTHFTDNDPNNDSRIYGPMETIEAPAHPNNANSILTFYAVWIPAETSGGNPVYLQDFNSTDCANLTSATFDSNTGNIYPGSVIALTDKRDNQVYTIAKLADGKCWMVENLRVGHDGTTGNNINDSSVTNESLSQGYGGAPGTYGSFVGLAGSATSFPNQGGTSGVGSNNMYKSDGSGDIFNSALGTLEDVGVSFYPGYRFPQYNDNNINSLVDSLIYTQDYSNPSSPTYTGTNYLTSNIYSYGNYYTWAAAMANTNFIVKSADAIGTSTSICPAGWVLPTSGNTSRDFGVLSQSYGGNGSTQSGVENAGDVISSRFRTFPNNFIFAGYYYPNVSVNRGTRGVYWSKSSSGLYDSSTAYYLDFQADSISLAAYWTKIDGSSIRCMVDPSSVEITLDSNDGTGSVSRVYGIPGNSVMLPTMSKSEDKVSSWNTISNGSGTSYTGSYTIPANSNGITLYAQWKPVYSIQYDGNGATNSNGMGTTDANGIKSVRQINIIEGNKIDLLPSNFKRAGHSFAGWSTNPNAWTHFTDNDPNNDSRIYGPIETIEAPAYPSNTNGILTLYAVWVPAETSGGNPVYLQDFGSTQCSNLTSATFDSTTGYITPGSVIALTDKRDNQVYTIAKLADGKCWMVENLRVGHDGTTGNNINDNSVTNESLSQGYGGTPGTYGSFVGLADTETNFSSSSTANSIYKSDGSHSTFDSTLGTLEDIGTTNNPSYRFPRYNDGNTNNIADSTTYIQNYVNTPSSEPTDSGTNYRTSSNIYSYGNYYSWAAAMANTKPFLKNPTASEAAGTSICPSGWVLPTSGSTTKNFANLSKAYGGSGGDQSNTSVGAKVSERIRAFPNNFVYSGFVSSGRSSVGVVGDYWSRTTGSNSNQIANYLFFDKSGIDASRNFSNGKYNGHSVRCIVGS